MKKSTLLLFLLLLLSGSVWGAMETLYPVANGVVGWSVHSTAELDHWECMIDGEADDANYVYYTGNAIDEFFEFQTATSIPAQRDSVIIYTRGAVSAGTHKLYIFNWTWTEGGWAGVIIDTITLTTTWTTYRSKAMFGTTLCLNVKYYGFRTYDATGEKRVTYFHEEVYYTVPAIQKICNNGVIMKICEAGAINKIFKQCDGWKEK